MAHNAWLILLAWNVLAEATASSSGPLRPKLSSLQVGTRQDLHSGSPVLDNAGTPGIAGIQHLTPSRPLHQPHVMRREAALAVRNETEPPPRYKLPGAADQTLWVDKPWYTDTDDSGIMVSASACPDGSNTLCVGILAFSNPVTITVTDVGDFGSNQWALVMQPDTLSQPGPGNVTFNVGVDAAVFVCQYVNPSTSSGHPSWMLAGNHYGFSNTSLTGPKLDLDEFQRTECFNASFDAGIVAFPRSNKTLTLVRALNAAPSPSPSLVASA
mmetsp:Transcript_94121/g.176908  ORF Transcript_94121/g.176908 Transcript_94121/m.176908 type:complete len:270 (-) Transcript_94121:106-915(-)